MSCTVELVGPPGAGKSTLGPRIADWIDGASYLHFTSRLPEGRPSLWTKRLVSVAANPSLAFRALRTFPQTRLGVRRAMQVTARDLMLRQLVHDEGRVYIVEEGPIHTLLWAAAEAHRRPISYPARSITPPDVLVYMPVNPQEAAHRVAGRTESLVAGMPFNEVCSHVEVYDSLARGLLAILDCPVIELDETTLRARPGSEISKALYQLGFPVNRAGIGGLGGED